MFFHKFDKKIPVLESLFNKVAGLSEALALQLYEKQTPTQVFSCLICEILKSAYFEEYLRTTASVVSFSWLSLPRVFFIFRLKLKWLKNGGTNVFIVTYIFLRIIIFFTLKYKSDIVFSVSRSLDQNFMKLEKRS